MKTKNGLKKLFFLAVAFCAVGAFLVGCKNDTPPTPTPEPAKEGYVLLEDYKAYICADLESAVNSIKDELTADQLSQVEAKKADGLAAINAASSILTIERAFEDARAQIAEVVPAANGVYSFASATVEERTKILGLLEEYAIKHGMTGISLFENGSYVMYNPRVTLGTENYIVGYGFGTLAEGSITADLDTESNVLWKRYYHTIEASDPGTINYLNDNGSQVGDFYAYIAASYYTNFMNSTKDGYEWVPELAKGEMEAVNPLEDGRATKWRFAVRTGKDGLKYTTNSTIASRAEFNNRLVELEDYLTPFKLLLNQTNQLFRGSELANQTTSAIKGAKAYYNATATNPDGGDFSNVGLKVYEENGVEYFEVEYVQPITAFYARYYISSSLYMPVPQSFIDLVTVQNYLGYNEDKSETPVDNSLSLGAYALERWDAGQQVVYKKNPNYVYADTKYSIEGIHINILTAAAEDREASIREFLAGKTDSATIPQTRLEEFKNDPRTRNTRGDSNFKLNINALDAETWEKFFGENGTISQNSKDDYWEVEPALSNEHFVKAISLSINRVKFADARGSVASVDFLAPNYLSDPENGVSYANTEAHKKAVQQLLVDTDGCGYNLELAREYFRMALSELEANGVYTPGTSSNPTVIELEIAWMYPQHETGYHNEIKQFLEDAFNDSSVSDGKYKLEVKFWCGAVWSEGYERMQNGKFDIGFGSISGNPLDPLNFLSTLSADPAISAGWTLNWGTDTNELASDSIVYKGMRWTFDALYKAATSSAIVVNGEQQPSFTQELVSHQANEDGSYTSKIEVSITMPENTEFEIESVVVCWYNDSAEGYAYKEEEVAYTATEMVDGKIIITITSSVEVVSGYYGDMGFDVYYLVTIDGIESEGLVSVFASFPEATA